MCVRGGGGGERGERECERVRMRGGEGGGGRGLLWFIVLGFEPIHVGAGMWDQT